ncbi:MAG TPA: hypothetical protein VFQ07_14835 [Candidatus Polarisedimenticolia bacterium]|nr:hypothetical protein [Candidatus Polarisedimenticolia bacterium]
MAAPETPTPAPRGSFLRSVRRAILMMLLLAMVGLVIYTWAAWKFTYSEGERAGYVQKFSKKGWLCKTWEGELAMANLPGAMPEVFAFTVHDEAVAAQLNKDMGERVSVHYEQHMGLPTSCFGETSYFVTQVRRVEAP